MTDIHNSTTRSKNMSAVKSRNTDLEIIVRKALFREGFRYRLHTSSLPGRPDIVLAKYKAAIFVNGCFWHGHTCKKGALPATRELFWQNKIEHNKVRDNKNISDLRALGYKVLVIWECHLKGRNKVDSVDLILEIRNWLSK